MKRGESGCGKTTLLNILSAYISPDSGQIEGAKEIGYLFQDEMLFSNLTVLENMRIILYAKGKGFAQGDQLIKDTLEKFNIGHLYKEKVAMLSGGERQRVELSGILLGDPDFIVLDEPIAKLDEANKHNILKVIMSAFKGKTLIIVSHEMEIIPEDFIFLRLKEGDLLYGK